MLFTAAGPLENYISGVILCHETLAQKTEGGKRLAALFEVGPFNVNKISAYLITQKPAHLVCSIMRKGAQ